MTKILLAYVPVLHEGYRRFFEKHRDVDRIYILGEEIIREFDHFRKDLRALPPEYVRRSIASWPNSPPVMLTWRRTFEVIRSHRPVVIMPDEEECREVARKYLDGCGVEFENIFLRWDRKKVLAEEEVRCDRVVPFEGLVGEMMQQAIAASKRATNLWRQVGAVIARDGEILLTAWNTQVPSSLTPYFEGDPRMFFTQGLHYELTTDEHAEARLVAEAAGIGGEGLKGADLFVTTFPCPPCAKLVARAGFRRLYFLTGYAKLDGEQILRQNGIEIIQVEMKAPDS